MNLGKLAARLICLSPIDGESSITNKISRLRFTLMGMSLASTRPCAGSTSEIDRSGQPARRPLAARLRNDEARAAWRIVGTSNAISIEQPTDQVESSAVSAAYFSL